MPAPFPPPGQSVPKYPNEYHLTRTMRVTSVEDHDWCRWHAGTSQPVTRSHNRDITSAGVRFPTAAEIFLLSSLSTPVLGPTQPLIHWVPGLSGQGMKLMTTHPHPVSRSGMLELYIHSPILMACCLIERSFRQIPGQHCLAFLL
jgi:hypothetical protein